MIDEFKKCTLTFYSDQEDKWGITTARKNTSGQFLAIHGFTIAVDPAIIPYGSHVLIPKLKEFSRNGEGLFYAHDTGSAVVSKKASLARGNDYPVIDVFAKVHSKDLIILNTVYGSVVEYQIIDPESFQKS